MTVCFFMLVMHDSLDDILSVSVKQGLTFFITYCRIQWRCRHQKTEIFTFNYVKNIQIVLLTI